MTFVVTENCIKCKYTDCVDVCPVECFHEGPEMLVIDPEECIDCALCVPECPIDAIYDEVDLPDDQLKFIKINEVLALEWPIIEGMIAAPDDAQEWEGASNKIQYLADFLDEGLITDADVVDDLQPNQRADKEIIEEELIDDEVIDDEVIDDEVIDVYIIDDVMMDDDRDL